MSRRAVVTGGAGFIGSHVCELLVSRGYHVDIIDNLSSGKRENVAALAKKMEVRTLDSSKPLLREGDTDKRTYYLVTGTLELTDRHGNRAMHIGQRGLATLTAPGPQVEWRGIDRVRFGHGLNRLYCDNRRGVGSRSAREANRGGTGRKSTIE